MTIRSTSPHAARAGALVLLAAACSGGRAPAASAPAPAAVNVAGRWAGVTTQGGAAGQETFTLLLVQDGDSLHGQVTIEGSRGRKVDGGVTGAVSGDRVTWADGARAYKFHGRVKGDQMSGVWAPTYVMTSTVALSLRRQAVELAGRRATPDAGAAAKPLHHATTRLAIRWAAPRTFLPIRTPTRAHTPPLRTETPDPAEPIVIRTYRYAYEAELARARLEAASIPCMLSSDSYAEAAGLPIRLAVRREDAAEAGEVLDAPPPLEDADLDAAALDAEPADDS